MQQFLDGGGKREHVDRNVVWPEGEFHRSFGDLGHKCPARCQSVVVIRHGCQILCGFWPGIA